PVDFSGVPVDLGEQDPFFASVYALVRKLGWGETTTYGALAKELGAGPEAARDVGKAMASNPIPLIVPCHRVLAAGGKIGGFSAPGGPSTKAKLLGLEGVRVGPPPPAQQAFTFSTGRGAGQGCGPPRHQVSGGDDGTGKSRR